MLTTTIDGLWVLQVLSGIELLAPELGLRPHFPSAEGSEAALAHPAAADLRSAGVINANNEVDDVVGEWLTVLARRDVALLLYAQTPRTAEASDRILLARFADWWVALERCGETIRLSAAGTATTEHSAGLVVGGQVSRLCGDLPPAEFGSATLDPEELKSKVVDRDALYRTLRRHKLSEDQLRVLMLASDPQRSTQVAIVAIQSGVAMAAARSHIEGSAVTVIDSPAGRLVAEQVERDGKFWMIVAPGTTSQISAAVQKMLRRLPAQVDWHSYRKAV